MKTAPEGLTDEATPEECGSEEVSDSYLIKSIRSGRIKKGLLLFFALTVAALTVLSVVTNSSGTLEAFRNYDLDYLAVTAALLVLDILLGTCRNHVFMKKLDPSVEFMTSLRANLANTFFGAITPSQGGGGPAQFYVYHRKGASIGQAVFVAAFNYLSTLVVFISGAVLAMVVLSGSFGNRYTGIIIVCFAVFTVEFVLFCFAFAKPALFKKLLVRTARWTSRKIPSLEKRINKVTCRIELELDAFEASARAFFRKHILMVPVSLLMTLVLYFNKYVIAFMVLRGLGIQADFMSVIAIQAVLMCIIYFSPSPGGSGIAELSIAALMSTVMPESKLGVFSFLQRFFLLYLPLFLGSIVVFHELRVLSSRIDSGNRGKTGGIDSSL